MAKNREIFLRIKEFLQSLIIYWKGSFVFPNICLKTKFSETKERPSDNGRTRFILHASAPACSIDKGGFEARAISYDRADGWLDVMICLHCQPLPLFPNCMCPLPLHKTDSPHHFDWFYVFKILSTDV